MHLDAADQMGGIDQAGVVRLDVGRRIDDVARRGCADGEATLCIITEGGQLRNALEVDDQIKLASSFFELGKQVGAAAQRPGPFAVAQGFDRFLYSGCSNVIERLQGGTSLVS